MADVLSIVAKIRAAKGKGDALAALLAEQAAVVKKGRAGVPRLPPPPIHEGSRRLHLLRAVQG